MKKNKTFWLLPWWCQYNTALISVHRACHTLPGRWNFPVKRPLAYMSKGLSTFLIPSMFPCAICLKVQGFWLFSSISACFLCMSARLSLLITWNKWIGIILYNTFNSIIKILQYQGTCRNFNLRKFLGLGRCMWIKHHCSWFGKQQQRCRGDLSIEHHPSLLY